MLVIHAAGFGSGDTTLCDEVTRNVLVGLAMADCDGDGVTNSKECTDGTNPKVPCDYVAASQTLTPKGGFDTLDCDDDGIPNIVEDTSGTDPNDPCSNTYANGTEMCAAVSRRDVVVLDTVDCDGDGVINGKECTDSTNAKVPCNFVATSITKPVAADTGACRGPENGVLALRVLLQGALFPTESSSTMITTGIMRDDLRSAGVITEARAIYRFVRASFPACTGRRRQSGYGCVVRDR